MIKEGNELDELIFDYLEGNLSAQEKEAFEIVLAEDKALQEQIKLWRNTIIAEPFASTKELEKQIIKPYKANYWSFSLNTLLGTLLFLFFSTTRINEARIHHPAEASYEVAAPQQSSGSVTAGSETHAVQGTKHFFSRKKIKDVTVQNDNRMMPERNLEVISSASLLDKPDTEYLMSDSFQPHVEIHEVRVPRQVYIKHSEKKKLTRSEQRAINKKLRKEYERKQEMKFLKGNVPYVVPLNSKNF